MQSHQSKKDLTKIFLTELGIPCQEHKTFMRWVWSWWANPVSPTSMRLTAAGHTMLTEKLMLKQYEFTLPKGMKWTGITLLQLDRNITSPFFIKGTTKIVFYSEQDSIMLALHGGDLIRYLSAFEGK